MVDISEKEFKDITGYIKANYGIKLGPEKKSLVVGRLTKLLIQNNFNNFTDYLNYVISDRTGSAASALINRITTNHTFFMREPDHFYFFRDRVLPYLKDTVKNKDLRIWSAGCSTGEEPYTLAMIIAEYLGEERKKWDTKILATDISEKVLEKAKKGLYPDDEVSSISSEWRNKYFYKYDNENSMLADDIKDGVIFRRFNLMEKQFPFRKKFHVIFCRNVMIYFDAGTRNELVKKFYEFTEDGGYLFTGHSESLSREETDYKYIMPAVYRKGLKLWTP